MPTNCSMPALAKAFESAGFTDVKTVLGSGNVLFTARAATEAALEKKAKAATADRLGRSFPTLVRSVESLCAIVAADPYQAFRLEPGSKRVVTFLRAKPDRPLSLPIELHGARILKVDGREVLS